MAKGKEKDASKGAPKGFARVLISSWDDEAKTWFWSANARLGQNGKPDKKGTLQEVARVNGEFYVTIPVAEDTLEAFCEKATTTFVTDTEGGKVKVAGHLAPAARKVYSDTIEPVRGLLRDMGIEGKIPDAETLQGMLDGAAPYSGRGGQAKVVSQDDLAKVAGDPEALAQLLMSKGIKVS